MSSDKKRYSVIFEKQTEIDSPTEDVFKYHEHSGSLNRLIPPWSFLRVLKESDQIKNGSVAIIEFRFGPLKFKYISHHLGYIKNVRFQDIMTQGPFKWWLHTHSFYPNTEHRCIVKDQIEYLLSPALGNPHFVTNRIQNYLERFFAYRYEIIKNDFSLSKQTSQFKKKRILISGSTGVIGSALIPILKTVGNHEITPLIRTSSYASYVGTTLNKKNVLSWDPQLQNINPTDLEGFDVIIHLGGSNIFGRWSKLKKDIIRNSRIQSTKLICDTILNLKKPPSTFICASAIGYYGNRCDEVLTEESIMGTGFLPNVCNEWENVSKPLISKGIRVLNLRFGLVLTPRGGLLKRLVIPSLFRIGLKIKKVDPILSWISIEDAIRIIVFAMSNPKISGPINVVSPKPARLTEFVSTVSDVLKIKFNLSINKSIIKIALGEVLDEVILTSSYVLPKKMHLHGYQFVNHDLKKGLCDLLGK